MKWVIEVSHSPSDQSGLRIRSKEKQGLSPDEKIRKTKGALPETPPAFYQRGKRRSHDEDVPGDGQLGNRGGMRPSGRVKKERLFSYYDIKTPFRVSSIVPPDDGEEFIRVLGFVLGDSGLCARISKRVHSDAVGYTWEKRVEKIIDGVEIGAE